MTKACCYFCLYLAIYSHQWFDIFIYFYIPSFYPMRSLSFLFTQILCSLLLSFSQSFCLPLPYTEKYVVGSHSSSLFFIFVGSYDQQTVTEKPKAKYIPPICFIFAQMSYAMSFCLIHPDSSKILGS